MKWVNARTVSLTKADAALFGAVKPMSSKAKTLVSFDGSRQEVYTTNGFVVLCVSNPEPLEGEVLDAVVDLKSLQPVFKRMGVKDSLILESTSAVELAARVVDPEGNTVASMIVQPEACVVERVDFEPSETSAWHLEFSIDHVAVAQKVEKCSGSSTFVQERSADGVIRWTTEGQGMTWSLLMMPVKRKEKEGA